MSDIRTNILNQLSSFFGEEKTISTFCLVYTIMQVFIPKKKNFSEFIYYKWFCKNYLGYIRIKIN